MEVNRHVQSAQNTKFVKVLKYIKKKYCKCLCVRLRCVLHNLHDLWIPVMFVVTCFWVVVVKNGRELLDHGTLKSAVSQE